MFSAALRNESPPAPIRPISNATIALFPQAGAVRQARSQYIDSSYYDVPWDEPQLVRELLLEPWPQRRWAARLYHRPVSYTHLKLRSRIGVSATLRMRD